MQSRCFGHNMYHAVTASGSGLTVMILELLKKRITLPDKSPKCPCLNDATWQSCNNEF